jgi:hypothetical protein
VPRYGRLYDVLRLCGSRRISCGLTDVLIPREKLYGYVCVCVREREREGERERERERARDRGCERISLSVERSFMGILRASVRQQHDMLPCCWQTDAGGRCGRRRRWRAGYAPPTGATERRARARMHSPTRACTHVHADVPRQQARPTHTRTRTHVCAHPRADMPRPGARSARLHARRRSRFARTSLP